ncbi:T7SS effector LXG polymorphic toxin [Virgibacillus sp. Bac330]|uniref:T7SS effector LXG polymorphic toxin n=1 Tax=Virgibacillus sp. Bac330 TaxID=2419841 RepID=UPI000EF46428|nr:T7SS effector LXG polymorphic toxin [Virgibacillus sp. Bac330]
MFIKALYVSDLHSYIDKTISRLEQIHTQVKNIQKSIEAMIALEDEFKGKLANSIRAFYQEVHMPFLLFLEGFITNYTDTLQEMKKSIQYMEPDKDGVIREDFISQDVRRGLERMEQITMDLTDEANAIIQSVSDIVDLRKIDDSEFLDIVQHGKKKIHKTLEKLYELDRHNTAKLEPIEQDIHMMKNYISQIRELGNNGQIHIGSYQARQLADQRFHKELISGIRSKAVRNAVGLETVLGEVGKYLLSQHLPPANLFVHYLQKKFGLQTMEYSYRAMQAAVAASGDRLTAREFSTIEHQVVSTINVSDYKKEWHGEYYTLINDRKVRKFKESDGSVTYELVSSIPDDRRQNLFQKSAQAFREIGSDVLKAAEDRNEAKFDTFYDFGNYITFGALNKGQDFSKGLQVREESMLHTPKDFVNWLTIGGVDMMHGTISPEETYSKEHWLSSFGLFSTVVGAKTFLYNPKSGSKLVNRNDVGEVISRDNTYTRSSLKIPTMLNIKEWMRTQIPKVNVVKDTTDGYHYTVSKGSNALKKESSNQKTNKNFNKVNQHEVKGALKDYQQNSKYTVKKEKQVVSFTKEQLASKPPYSRDPIKWQKKGGGIEINEHGIWTYIDWEVPPNKVSYPNGFPDFKSAGLVIQEVQLRKFKSYSADFEVADKLAPNGPKSSKNTWHHHEDLKTMQEVNKILHRRFTHRGGMALSKE